MIYNKLDSIWNSACRPYPAAKLSTRIATIGDKSSIPIGGTIRRKGSKYGSQIRPIKLPIEDSLAPGNQDMKM